MTTFDLDPVPAATPRITVVQTSPDAVPGEPATGRHPLVDGARAALHVVRPFAGDDLPAVRDLDGLVVLGGEGSAFDDARAPWLPALRELLHDAATSGVPTLAVGLGAQLLAVAAGGRVEVAPPPGREIGVTKVYWRHEAATDPVLAALAGGEDPLDRFVSAHGDAIVDLPASAVWLASSNMYPYQAFRLGSALGVQFHPEATRDDLAAWCEHDDVDTAAVLAVFDERADRIAEAGARLAGAFVDEVRRAAAHRPALA